MEPTINNLPPTFTPTAFAPQPPTPPQPPQHSNKKLLIGLFTAAILLILAGSAYFLFTGGEVANEDVVNVQPMRSVEPQQSVSLAPAAFSDRDLLISYLPPREGNNSAPALSTTSSITITPADSAEITRLVASSTVASLPALDKSQKLLAKYKKELTLFDENAAKPYRCDAERGENCPLGDIRRLGMLAALRSLTQFQMSTTSESRKTAQDLIMFGQNITAEADGVITLLVGWELQKTGYTTLSIVNSRDKETIFSRDQKNVLVGRLKVDQKRVSQYYYSIMANVIERLTPGSTVKPFIDREEEAFETFKQEIIKNPDGWDPLETKKYFYTSIKITVDNIQIECGQPLKEPKLDLKFDPNNLEVKKEANYIGKMLYTERSTSIEALNKKRCELEQAIKNI